MSMLRFHIDYISPREVIKQGYISFFGWCFAKKNNIKSLYINIGRNKFKCCYGYTRPDLIEHGDNQGGFHNTGFSCKISNLSNIDDFYLEAVLENNNVIREKIISKNKVNKYLKISHENNKKNELVKSFLSNLTKHYTIKTKNVTNNIFFYSIYDPIEQVLFDNNISFWGWYCDSNGAPAKYIKIIINNYCYECDRTTVRVDLRNLGFPQNQLIGFKKNILLKKKGTYSYSIIVEGQDGIERTISNGFVNVLKDSTPESTLRHQTYYEEYLEKLEINNKIKEKNLFLDSIKEKVKNAKNNKLISIIMPTYNTKPKFLKDAINSVINQVYPNWELCVVDDCSTKKSTIKLLEKYRKFDKRIKIKFLNKNCHIAECSNNGIQMARGEFIALLDHDDVLDPLALYETVKIIEKEPTVDYIYTDEDKIDENGNRSKPYYKPAWSPDYFLTCMYTCHLSMIRTSLIKELNGFRKGFEGAQDYDLILRITEKARKIVHIPKLLYSWRIHADSTASEKDNVKNYAYTAAEKAIDETLKRRKLNAIRLPVVNKGHHRIKHYVNSNPLVSIVIPTAGECYDKHYNILFIEKIIGNIIKTNTYVNYEIIVIDNGNLDRKRLNKLNLKEDQIKFSTYDYDANNFNLSQKLNQGAKLAKGEFLVILNDDLIFLNQGWMEEMIGLCQLEHVGIVGAKLFFPDGTIQHAGVVLPECNPYHVFYRVHNSDSGYGLNLQSVYNYSAVTGACIMTKTKIFRQLNGWAEDLPLCYNDIDYCLRVRELGYYVCYTPYVKATHFESASRENDGSIPPELKEFKEKWLDKYKKDIYYNVNFSKDGFYVG